MEEEIEIKDHKIEIIENQLWIIASLIDTDNTLYDTFLEDKIKTIARAIKVINKCQEKIMKEI